MGGNRNRSRGVGGKAGGGGGKGGGGGGKNGGGARQKPQHPVVNLDFEQLALPVEEFLGFMQFRYPLLFQPDGGIGDVDECIRQLKERILLVHPLAAADPKGFGKKCRTHADDFNGPWPCTNVATTNTRGGLLVGGLESAGEVGAENVKRVDCVYECRNNETTPVRHRIAPTAVEYRRNGADYYQYDVNASLRKDYRGCLSNPWLFFAFAEDVLRRLLVGQLLLLHCASLVVGLARAPGRAEGRL